MSDPSMKSTNGDISTKRDNQEIFISEMANRVRELAEGRYNGRTLGVALGIPSSSAGNYWAGQRAWPVELVPELAHLLNTNVDYLLNGDGESGSFKDRKSAFRAQPAERSDEVDIPQIDFRYGMGGTFLEDSVEVEMRSFSRAWLRQFTDASPDSLFWARGQGNSMSPTIEDGEVVLIDRGQMTISMGDSIYAFAYGQVGMMKRLRSLPDGSIEIHSDNPGINLPPARAVDDELHLIGRVVAVVKRI